MYDSVKKNLMPIRNVVYFLLLLSFSLINFLGDEFFLPQVYYFVLASFTSGIIFSAFFIIRRVPSFLLEIKTADIVFIALLIYFLINARLVAGFPYDHVIYKEIGCVVLFYFVARSLTKEQGYHRVIALLFLSLGVIECCISLFHSTSIIPSKENSFQMAGTFENPALLAAYIAILFPIAISILLNKVGRNTFIFVTSIVFVVTGAITLIYLYSRAAWLGVLLGTFVVFEHRYKIISNLFKNKIKKAYKIGIVTVIIFLTIIVGYGLYRLNPDSVGGRALIYEVVLQDAENYILTGSGIETFPRNYNLAQADYFRSNAGSERGMGSAINVAFNEYLQVLSETGLVGLLLVIILIIIVLINYKKFRSPIEMGSIGGLTALMVCALFSYPLHNIPIIIVSIILFCILVNKLKTVRVFTINNKYLFFAVIGISILGLYYTIAQINTINRWKETVQNVKIEGFEPNKKQYEELYQHLSSNKYFLYNYAMELIESENYDAGLTVLTELSRYHIDDRVLSSIATSYEKKEDFQEAEYYYLLAYYVSPDKIYSLSRLVNLYYETGRSEIADQLADLIINKNVKVNSAVVRKIKDKVEAMRNR